jgi:hypothetical protein
MVEIDRREMGRGLECAHHTHTILGGRYIDLCHDIREERAEIVQVFGLSDRFCEFGIPQYLAQA